MPTIVEPSNMISYVNGYIGDIMFQELTDSERSAIGTISAHPLYEKMPYNWSQEFDQYAIEMIGKAFDIVPGVPEDIIIYRGGFLKDRKYGRRFLSASLSKDTALKYADGNILRLHKIVVKKGAKILPLCAVRRGMGADSEYEIIIDSQRVKNFGIYARYK